MDTQDEGEHDPYLQLLSKYGYSQSHKPGLASHGNVAEYRPSICDNDILLHISNAHLTNLLYVRNNENFPYSKGKKFIQTKVAAINCGVLT